MNNKILDKNPENCIEIHQNTYFLDYSYILTSAPRNNEKMFERSEKSKDVESTLTINAILSHNHYDCY